MKLVEPAGRGDRARGRDARREEVAAAGGAEAAAGCRRAPSPKSSRRARRKKKAAGRNEQEERRSSAAAVAGMPELVLVVGLGNPGEEYEHTPHNLGFLVVDRLAERHAIRVSRQGMPGAGGVGEIGGKPVMLAKPQTFMNLSGAVGERAAGEARD